MHLNKLYSQDRKMKDGRLTREVFESPSLEVLKRCTDVVLSEMA